MSGAGRQVRLLVGVTVGMSAATLLRGQLAWFREQGWDVTLATTPDDAARDASAREGVPLAAVHMQRGISPFHDLVSLVRWVRVIRRLRPDAVNVGTPKAALLGGLAAWLLRVPKRLYVVRGLRLEGTSGVVARVLWVMEWISMRTATDVLFVSRSLAAEARRRGLRPAGRAWLIGDGSSNGVDAKAVAARAAEVDRAALRDRLGLASDDLVVGVIGRFDRDKGIGTLTEAFADPRLDVRARLLLVGTVEEPDLEAEIDALGDRVVRVGWTKDVWGLLSAVDVLCLPTRREGFPNVVLEAAAAGVPAITTRATGAVDSVVDGRTGFLVDVDDPAALVARINELAADPAQLARLGAAARERAASRFVPEDVWRGIAEILSGEANPEHAVAIGRKRTEGSIK